MDLIEEAKKVVDIEIESLINLKAKFDESFIKAVDLLKNCQGRVVVSGLGKSGLIGRKIAATMASTGTPAIFLHPAESIHGDLGILKREDVVILISNSGETEETLRILPSLKRFDIKIIAMTGRTRSNLAKYSDVVLDVGVEREACPNNLAPTASTTTLLAMGDALAIVLLKEKGFRKEDFAFLHPGGSIGKRLLMKVDDVMHSGDDMPAIQIDSPLKQAIFEITSKGLGVVCIVDKKNKLCGVITDGDLRRAIEKHEGSIFSQPVTDIMTEKPVTILSGCLAAKAVRLMEDRQSQISVLPVVDNTGIPVGIIRLHDIVKAGLY